MPHQEINIDPVTHITTDSIGKPGQRVFYIQARQDDRLITLLVEKIQIQTLALGVEQFVEDVRVKFPELPEASAEYKEEDMHILPPVDPMFRVGEVGLGYDQGRDMMILVLHEIQTREIETEKGEEEAPEEEGTVMRLWCTRSQLRAMSHWGLEVASRGRPICAQCGEPMEPEGHFCPKKNGHKH